MYKRLLVPIDGSFISEAALEYSLNIMAGCAGAELSLLTVVETVNEKTYRQLEEWEEVLRKESVIFARNYLDQIMYKIKAEGVIVKVAVIEGNPAEIILDYAEKNDIDLIIMTTHGRTGAKRWIFGSVAQKVIHNSTVPVIIVPARIQSKNEIMNMAD